MTNNNQVPQRRGRPLSTDVTDAVYATTLAIVAEAGLTKTSRREIAARAGVSRQTLYNRWASVGDIVLDALLVRGERELGAARDAGTNEVSMREYVSGLADALNRWAAPGLAAVAALAQQDPAFARRFRERFLAPRHRRLTEVVAAHCAPGQDAARIAELIAGSMWYRLLVSGQPLDRAWIDDMTALVGVSRQRR